MSDPEPFTVYVVPDNVVDPAGCGDPMSPAVHGAGSV